MIKFSSSLSTPLGGRLILAFLSMVLLTLLLGLISTILWEQLKNQVDDIVTRNIPSVNYAYQLERTSTDLIRLLNKQSQTQNIDQYQQYSHKINQLMVRLSDTYKKLKINQTDKFEVLIKLKKIILSQDQFLMMQINDNRKLNETFKKVSWLHEDMTDEVHPLLQEIEWHAEKLLEKNLSEIQLSMLVKEFTVLQQLSNLENELIALIDELNNVSAKQDLQHRFIYIDFKSQAIKNILSRLTVYPSTIEYRQIMTELLALIARNGELHSLLNNKLTTQKELILLTTQLTEIINQFQQQVAFSVNKANAELNHLNENTQRQVKTGQIIIILVSLFAVFMGLMVIFVLVKLRFINRLNALGIAFSKVANGNIQTVINIDGNDEIGQLANKLTYFCQQLMLIEKTNALNLINNTQACLITCLENGQIESVNPSAKKLIFNDLDRSLVYLWQVFGRHNQDKIKPLFDAGSSLSKTGKMDLIIELRNAKQDLYLQMLFRRFDIGQQSKIMLTIIDITVPELTSKKLATLVKQKTTDLQLQNQRLAHEIAQHKQTQNELIQTAKMAVLGQTMTSLAHELNQPLAAIKNYIFIGKMQLSDKKEADLFAILMDIEKMGQRMERIIKVFRQFSKKSFPDKPLEKVSLYSAVNNALLLIETRIKKEQCEFITHVKEHHFVLAETAQLEQILINIFVNSLDEISPQETKKIVIDVLADKEQQLIIISDSGRGFNHHLLPKLFTPFTTSKDVGLGIGLSICRAIMHKFSGEIYLASSLDGGAMVILEFTN